MTPAPKGQLIIISVVLLGFVLALTVAVVTSTTITSQATVRVSHQRQANEAAAAGVEKALFCLNQTDGTNCGGTYGGSYAGEADVVLGPATFTTTVTTIDSVTREIQSVGYYPNSTSPLATQTIRARAGINTDSVSFNYALQTGYGGLEMANNTTVNGNAYSNFNVDGAPGALITGDVWVAGGTALTADQQSSGAASDQPVGQASANADVAQSFIPSQTEVLNKVTLYLKKVDTPSDKTVRILTDNGGVPSGAELANGTLQSSLVTGSYGWIDVSMSTPPTLTAGTRYWIVIDSSANASKYYQWGLDVLGGYPSGDGMQSTNWSAGSPAWTSVGGDLAFQTWMGGINTVLSDMEVGGDAHANTITNATITRDAYYQTISGSTVGGISYPGSADPPTVDFPISDAQVTEWKQTAEAGGTIIGDYDPPDDSSVSLGPVEITGNLILENNTTLTVTGTIYVHGNISLENNIIVNLDPSFGSLSGIIVADGVINPENNVTFNGAGPGSYILMITTSSANPAIDVENNVVGSLFYAADGVINVENNVDASNLSGHTIKLENNATLTYDIGLASAVFSSGPGASWVLQQGTWREIK